MRILEMAILVIALTIPALADAHIDWQRGHDMPSARDSLGFGIVDGMLVVAGGAYWKDEQKHYSNQTIAYSPKTGKWVQLPFLPKPGAYGASAVYKGQLLVAGGANETSPLASCIRLVKKNGAFRWERLPDLPHPVSGARGAVIDGKFLVISGSWGEGEAGFREASPTVLELDMANPKAWKERPIPGGFAARTGIASAVIGDGLFVFGGHGVQKDGALGNFDDAWVMQGATWKRISNPPVPSRWTVALPLDGARIGLFGGYGEGFLAQTLIYDTDKDTYTQSTALPLAVCNQAAGIIGDTIYLAGGEDIARHRASALFIGTPK